VYHTSFSYRQSARGLGLASPRIARVRGRRFRLPIPQRTAIPENLGKDAVLIAILVTIAAGCLVGAPDALRLSFCLRSCWPRCPIPAAWPVSSMPDRCAGWPMYHIRSISFKSCHSWLRRAWPERSPRMDQRFQV
jgi:hypothetical protein